LLIVHLGQETFAKKRQRIIRILIYRDHLQAEYVFQHPRCWRVRNRVVLFQRRLRSVKE
jgi:hypothetical protein